MNSEFAKKLYELNNDFYRNQSMSFSDTRHAKWPGWERCLDETRADFQNEQALHVLDMACGNLRFEEYLAKYCEESQVNWQISVHALDACDDLIPDMCAGRRVVRNPQRDASGSYRSENLDKGIDSINGVISGDWGSNGGHTGDNSSNDERASVNNSSFSVAFTNCDIMQALEGDMLKDALKFKSFSEKSADLTVAFGFMHHIPLPEWRLQLLNDMISVTAPGGFVCVSFWRFMDDEGMAAKAYKTHDQAIDYLIQNKYFDGCFEGMGAQNPWIPGQLEVEESQGVSNDESRDATALELRKPVKEVRDAAAFGSRKFDISQQFNEGDYLLGWRNTPGAYRYCHSFSDEEIDSLVASVASKAKCVARFRADGRTGNLNEYLVLKVR